MDEQTASSLSARERQILVLAAKGLTDSAIALKLEISTATVGTYWTRIRSKMGSHSRTELVATFMRQKASATMEELRKENERLAEELRSQTAKMDSSKGTLDLLRRVIGAAPDAIMLVNEKGIIEYANEEAERLFGYERQELAHKSVAELIPKRYHGLHSKHRQHYMEHPIKKRMGEHHGTAALRKDGTEFLTATTLSAVKTPQGVLVSVFMRELQLSNIIDISGEFESLTA